MRGQSILLQLFTTLEAEGGMAYESMLVVQGWISKALLMYERTTWSGLDLFMSV
jgi:hypothetical protein